MKDTKKNLGSLLSPQLVWERSVDHWLAPEACMLVSVAAQAVTTISLPEDPSKRVATLIAHLEDMVAGMGYLPIGYVSVASVKDQLQENASTDPLNHVSDERILKALRFLLEKENRPAGFEAGHDELVRAAAAKVQAEPGSPKD